MNTFPAVSLFLLLLFSSACTSPDRKVKTDTATTTDTLQPGERRDSVSAQDIPLVNDTLITLSLADKPEQAVRGRLGRKGPSITCVFTITKPGALLARLVPDRENCNIRFNQIVMPGDQTDGPFGRELRYTLPKKGLYKLIIGHNLMAGDPEACDFMLKLTLQ